MSVKEKHRLDSARLEKQGEQDLERAAASKAMQDGPILDFSDMDPEELWDHLTDADIESEEYQSIKEILKPYLTSSEMMADFDEEEYYDDRSRLLLNTNKAERVIKGREYPDLCTGVFREIAQDVNGDVQFDGERTDWSEQQKEAVRMIMTDIRNARQSLGDGTFLEAVAEMHIHTERSGGDEPSRSGGISRYIPGL